MNRNRFGVVLLLASALAVSVRATPAPQAAGPLSRTIYVSVTDKEGKPVPGMTPADFKVKDGKDATVTKVEVPTTRAKIAVLMEEALSPDTVTRQAILDFAKRAVKIGDVSVIAAGIKNTVANDFTADLTKILAGLNSVALLQGRQGNHMAEGIYELAKSFQASKVERPIIVGVALDLKMQMAEQPDKVLNDLRLSGAIFEVVAVQFNNPTSSSLDAGSEVIDSAKVTGEGPKNSGGRKIDITSSRAIPNAMMQVANDLEGQYALTYELPAGAKLTDRISVQTTRKNVQLLAPTRAIASK